MHRSETARRLQAGVLTAWAVYALGGTPAWAAASDAPRVTLAPLGADTGLEKPATKFGQLLADELKTREDDIRWAAFPKGTGAPAAAPKKEKASSSKEAAEALAQGQQLMDDLKFEDAVAALKKGIELAEAEPATADFRDVDYALVRMAAGYVRMGEEKKAQQALFQVARLNPDYQLPEGQFPPVFRHEFEKAQKRAEKSAKGTLSIDGPSGATAFLNGRDLGMLPVQQENVAVGMHYVRVEGAHGERFGQAVEVKASGAKVHAAFSGGAAAAAVVAVELRVGSSLQPDTATRAAQVCKALDAEFLVVGYVSRAGERRLAIGSALYSARRQGFARLKRFEFDEDVVTANVEAFQLADEVVSRVKAFESPDPLPLSLSGEAPTVVAKATPTEVRRPSKPPSDAVVTPLVPKEGEEGAPRVRALQHKSEIVDARGTGSTAEEPTEHKTVSGGGVPWWVWVVAGAGVAAAAGGGYFAYSQATRPVTGSAGFSWGH
jgi:hypothetical protein